MSYRDYAWTLAELREASRFDDVVTPTSKALDRGKASVPAPADVPLASAGGLSLSARVPASRSQGADRGAQSPRSGA